VSRAPELRVSLVQAATRWHDADGNRALYGELMAPLRGATDLIILPETFTSGFSNDALADAESMDGPTVDWLQARAADLGAVITGSLQCRVGESVFNRMLWVTPDGAVSHYDKRHLFRMANEHQRYAAGKETLTVDLLGWRVRPMVCYDLRFPVYSRNRITSFNTAELDYDLLIFVANWPAPRRYAWSTLLRARAIENLSYCVGVNRVGSDGNGVDYAGDSALLDVQGRPIIEFGDQPQVATARLSAVELDAWRQRFPAHLDADRFELLG
jgi:predicted amidohydrolase